MSMSAELWTIAEMWQTDVDLTGFAVEARDGKIGPVDQATWDEAFGYLVVNHRAPDLRQAGDPSRRRRPPP